MPDQTDGIEYPIIEFVDHVSAPLADAPFRLTALERATLKMTAMEQAMLRLSELETSIIKAYAQHANLTTTYGAPPLTLWHP